MHVICLISSNVEIGKMCSPCGTYECFIWCPSNLTVQTFDCPPRWPFQLKTGKKKPDQSKTMWNRKHGLVGLKKFWNRIGPILILITEFKNKPNFVNNYVCFYIYISKRKKVKRNLNWTGTQYKGQNEFKLNRITIDRFDQTKNESPIIQH